MTVSYDMRICLRFSEETLGGFCIRCSNLLASDPNNIGVSFIGLAIIYDIKDVILQLEILSNK